MADTRRLRLRAVWLLVAPFLWFARPTAPGLAVGAALAVSGLLIRCWAAGTIRKERELTTSGPYAFTRNPLYLGTFFLGIGVALGGGHWIWPALFVAFYVAVYLPTMAGEARLLAERFGARYGAYAAAVPVWLPRLTPWRDPDGAGPGFTWGQYRRHREWEAALGAVFGYLFLVGKWWLGWGLGR